MNRRDVLKAAAAVIALPLSALASSPFANDKVWKVQATYQVGRTHGRMTVIAYIPSIEVFLSKRKISLDRTAVMDCVKRYIDDGSLRLIDMQCDAVNGPLRPTRIRWWTVPIDA